VSQEASPLDRLEMTEYPQSPLRSWPKLRSRSFDLDAKSCLRGRGSVAPMTEYQSFQTSNKGAIKRTLMVNLMAAKNSC
jgi:hypothetical protein